MPKGFIWAAFYSSVVGIRFHPKNPPPDEAELQRLAMVADYMMGEYLRRFPEE